MPLLVLAFLTGIVLIQQFSQLPPLSWLYFGCVLLCGSVYKRYWKVAALLSGMLWATGFALYRLAEELPKSLEGVDISLNGYVSGLPEYEERRVHFDFYVSAASENVPHKLHLSWYFPQQIIKAGQKWQFTVRLKRPHSSLNPAGFDYEQWLFTQGIRASGYIRNPAPLLIAESDKFSISSWREAISLQLSQLLKDNPNLGLIKALSIGLGSEISQSQWQLFRRTGTIHLLVISGSHISLIAVLIYFVGRQLCLMLGLIRISAHSVAAYLSLLGSAFYAALAGFSVPTQRALVMIAVAMFAIIQQRHLRMIDILAVALSLVLMLDPLAVLASGFWLSFAAVGLILYTQAKRLHQVDYVFELIKIHLITALGLALLLIFFFQQVSLIAPLANFFAVPIVSFLVVPLLLLAVLIMFIAPALAKPLLEIVAQFLQQLCVLLENLAALPFANIHHPQPDWWAILLGSMGILLLLAPKGIPARWLSIPLLLPVLFLAKTKPERAEFTLTLLDVGQGLAAVIQTANHVLIFDTGAKYSTDFDMGAAVVVPFLYYHGIKQVDRLIISHGDNDHIGGVNSIVKDIPVSSVYSSVPKLLPQLANVINCTAGQQWQWDEVRFTMLSPPASRFETENNNSCVLKIDSAFGSALLTGDIEVLAEQNLLQNSAGQLHSDILIAPHHGSNSSSSLAFLQQVQPKLILIPAGYRNRFGFPAEKVLQRYQQLNIAWLSSANSGAITVNIAKTGITTTRYRQQNQRYWHDK